MDAQPLPPAGSEKPEELKKRLLAELADAREGVAGAADDLRHACNVKALVRDGLAGRVPAVLSKHPLSWATAAAAIGFLVARRLAGGAHRRRAAKPADYPAPTARTMAKAWLLSTAGALVKPVVQDFLLRQMVERPWSRRTARTPR
jgi:hypothetical protein